MPATLRAAERNAGNASIVSGRRTARRDRSKWRQAKSSVEAANMVTPHSQGRSGAAHCSCRRENGFVGQSDNPR
jgi:hypothetical protein